MVEMLDVLHPLMGREYIGAKGLVSLQPAPVCARFNLRIAPEHLAQASAIWGMALPNSIGQLVAGDGYYAACIGPDEWFLILPINARLAIEEGFAELYQSVPHSLVDISHREVGILVEGPDAAQALQASIAFDVINMPVGSGRRTIIDKAQIILLREAPDRFRVEVWNSFSDHVWGLLAGICREIEIGV
jgi:sarcosine oxidase subunit gamma